MDPKTVETLRERSEFRELVAFLAAELAKCDSLEGLEALTFTERAYEATARVRTKERLEAMLGQLIHTDASTEGVNPAEYAV